MPVSKLPIADACRPIDTSCTPRQELQALYEVRQILASCQSQRVMLQSILRVAEERLGIMRGTVMMRSSDELVLEVHSQSPEEVEGDSRTPRYKCGEGIMGEVMRTGRSAIVPRVTAEPRFRNRIHRQSRPLKDRDFSFVCVPIVVEEEVVGTLSFDLPREDNAGYLAQSEHFLSIVATMIAADIKARRLTAAEREKLEAENLRLRDVLEDYLRPENMVGNSRAMQHVYSRISQVADFDTTILIRGESGTGKENVAAAIHYNSPRRSGPFVKVNCAALSENLLESELFGHEKGAFTGAVRTRAGRLEQAEGGTLFLDEIGDFSAATQVKLLRILQEREYERVGSNATHKADVRIISATNRDLEQAVQRGDFRQDLYYRINVFPLVLPPLRERGNDVLLLANYFVQRFADKLGKSVDRINTPAINMLMAYHWPGNVRELENCIEHAVLLSTDGVIQGHHLPPTLQMPGAEDNSASSLRARTEALERDMIVDALKNLDGNVTAAARVLDITPRMMRYKLKKLGLDARGLPLRNK